MLLGCERFSKRNKIRLLYWPQANAVIVGTNFTWRGWVNDPTATVLAQVVSTNLTNTVAAVVGRDGKFWAEDMPLTGGTNWLTLWATNAAGLTALTNIPVVNSSLTLTIDPLTGDLWGPTITVTGTFNGFANYTVWVNGVKAVNNGNGTWTANNVPLPLGGTALVQARAIPNTDHSGNGTGGSGGAASSASDPGNPNSPQSPDAEAEVDKEAKIILQSGTWSRIITDHTTGIPNPITNLYAKDWHWTAGTGGSLSQLYVLGSTPGLTNQYYAALLPDGTFPIQHSTEYSGGSPNEYYWTNHELVVDGLTSDWRGNSGQEKGDASAQGAPGTDKFEERCGTPTMILLTGGKGQSHRQSIFSLSATAQLEVAGTGENDGRMVDGPVLPAEMITIDGQALGGDAIAWKVYPDNTTQVVTPEASFPLYRFAELTATPYRPYIAANNIALDPQKIVPQATFCVGQHIDFQVGGLPGMTNAPKYDWSLSEKYVNHRWQLEQPVYVPELPPSWQPYGSVNYDVDTNLLKTATPFAWFISDGNKDVSAKIEILFNNGQRASVNVQGKFDMYRPVIEVFQLIGTAQIMVYSNSWLGVGNRFTGDHTMAFRVDIKSIFTGRVGWTQLISGEFDSTIIPEILDGYELDNSEWIHNTTYAVDLGSSSVNQVSFDDGPFVKVFLNPTAMSLGFKTYLRFKPNAGDDNIYVTLDMITWGASASASKSNGIWSVTLGSSPSGPSPTGSSDFPQWTTIFINSHN